VPHSWRRQCQSFIIDSPLYAMDTGCRYCSVHTPRNKHQDSRPLISLCWPAEQIDVDEDVLAVVEVELMSHNHNLSHGIRRRAHHDNCAHAPLPHRLQFIFIHAKAREYVLFITATHESTSWAMDPSIDLTYRLFAVPPKWVVSD